MKITAPVGRPFLLQIARRHRDLVGRGGNGGVEADPVGVVADIGIGTRLLVAQLRHAQHRALQAVLAAVVAVGDLQLALVAEMRHHLVVEEGAVGGQEGALGAVGETLRRVGQREVERHRGAGCQRGFQPVDGETQGLVRAQRVVRRKAQRGQREVGVEVHDQLADRRAVLVDQSVVAADVQPALVGMDVHVGLHRGDARLRQVLVPREFLLVVGALLQLRRAALVMIEHAGVVVDPRAAAGERQQRQRQRDLERRVQACARLAQAVAPRVVGAAHPEQRRQQQQRHGQTGPVRIEPQHAGEEAAVAVHVRIRRARRGAVVVDVLLPVQQIEADHADHQPHDGQQVADEFVVRQHLQEQRQHRQQHERHRLQRQRFRVQPQFEMGIAVHQLPADAEQRAGQQKRRDHRQQRAQLRHQRHPVRQRERVGDFGRALAALAPHQLARVERDDDVQQPLETAAHGLQHLVRHRPGGGAVDAVRQRQRAEQVGQPQRQHDQERHPAQHAQRVERELPPQLQPVRAQVVGQLHPGQRQRGRAGRRAQQRRLGARLAPRQLQAFAIRPEQQQRGAQQAHADSAPQQPVEQQHAAQRRQLVVGLIRRPVTRHQRQRAAAERIEHGGDVVVVDVAGEQADHALQHEEGDQPEVGDQQRAAERGQQKQQRGDEQQVRQHQHAEAPGVAVPVRRAQPRGVDPRHQAAQRDAQRARQHHRQRGQVAGGEAATEVGATADRGGEHQLGRALLEIAQRRPGHEHRGQQRAQHGEHAEQPRDHQRRVAQHVAAGATQDHRIGADQRERERAEHRGDDPEQRRAQLLAPLEAEDLEEAGLAEHG